MSEERRRVLELLSSGKISTEEAERLMTAIEEGSSTPTTRSISTPRRRPRYLRLIADTPTEKVDIRVPLFLLRAGMKLASLLPRSARGSITSAFREKGIDIDLTKGADLQQLIEGLEHLQIEAESGRPGNMERVRIYCE